MPQNFSGNILMGGLLWAIFRSFFVGTMIEKTSDLELLLSITESAVHLLLIDIFSIFDKFYQDISQMREWIPKRQTRVQLNSA